MGNAQNFSVRSLAAVGKAARTGQRSPLGRDKSALEAGWKPRGREAAPAPRVASIRNPKEDHPNPYYIPHTTEQDPMALRRAYGYETANLDPAKLREARPLGTNSVDFSKLDTEAMQTKNEDLDGFLAKLGDAITSKPAPNVMASLEEQIIVLRFLGADPRHIEALQRKLDEQNAQKAEQAAKEAQKPPSTDGTPAPATSRITLNSKEILQTASFVADHNAQAGTQMSFVKQQLSGFDPYPESIAAAHASRAAAPMSASELAREDRQPKMITQDEDGDFSEETIYKHDPFRALPSDRYHASISTYARSSSANPDIVRTIKGLVTTEQLNLLVNSGSSPLSPDFPVTNAQHLQFLKDALRVPITHPVETNEKQFKRRIPGAL